MHKKAESVLEGNTIYLILLVIAIIPIALSTWNYFNGAGIWSDFYAKEITRVINSAEPGDLIELDIHQATKIATRNDVKTLSEVFTFDNSKNGVCVKLSPGKRNCYLWFNQVDIYNPQIKISIPSNKLIFQIREKAK